MYSLFFSEFNETQIYSERVSKNKKIQNFIKIRPVRAELFHAVGETDMTILIVTFHNFANSLKN